MCTGGAVLRWWLQNPDLLQILSMGQKIVHSWNEIGGWNTMDISFSNLYFAVGPKRNLVTSFTHISDVGCLIQNYCGIRFSIRSEFDWAAFIRIALSIYQVSLWVRAAILCQGCTNLVPSKTPQVKPAFRPLKEGWNLIRTTQRISGLVDQQKIGWFTAQNVIFDILEPRASQKHMLDL